MAGGVGVGEVKVLPKTMYRGTHCMCDGGYRTRTQHTCKEFEAAFRAFVMADTEPGPTTKAQNI